MVAFPLALRGPGFPSASPTDGVCLLSHHKKGKYLVQSASRQRQTYGRCEASLGAWENTVKALQWLLNVGLPLSLVGYKSKEMAEEPGCRFLNLLISPPLINFIILSLLC